MIQITIPLPPSLNNAFLNAGKRGRIKSPEYRAWCNHADMLFKLRSDGMPRIEGTYGVMICVPSKMRGDIDNRIKPIVDMLVRSGLVDDDSKMQFVSVGRQDGIQPSCALVLAISVKLSLYQKIMRLIAKFLDKTSRARGVSC